MKGPDCYARCFAEAATVLASLSREILPDEALALPAKYSFNSAGLLHDLSRLPPWVKLADHRKSGMDVLITKSRKQGSDRLATLFRGHLVGR